MGTVKKAKFDAGPKHTNDGKFRHIYSMWMAEFSVTPMFWSCVTLGFSNSVQYAACNGYCCVKKLDYVSNPYNPK
jgi:hypothetical protein